MKIKRYCAIIHDITTRFRNHIAYRHLISRILSNRYNG